MFESDRSGGIFPLLQNMGVFFLLQRENVATKLERAC